MPRPSTTPKLRAHTAQLVSWCVAAESWGEMQARLRIRGTDVAVSTIYRFCSRQGFARLNKNTIHYDATLSRLWLAGKIRLTDLKPQLAPKTKHPNNPHEH